MYLALFWQPLLTDFSFPIMARYKLLSFFFQQQGAEAGEGSVNPSKSSRQSMVELGLQTRPLGSRKHRLDPHPRCWHLLHVRCHTQHFARPPCATGSTILTSSRKLQCTEVAASCPRWPIINELSQDYFISTSLCFPPKGWNVLVYLVPRSLQTAIWKISWHWTWFTVSSQFLLMC